ncbi:hypothetical protein A8A12_19960 [Serratia marcescens]|nr:hypothetical protein A8A12_19960 [Serratia marcescens]
MQTEGFPSAGASRRLMDSGLAMLLILLMLSFRGDAQSHSHGGHHASALQRVHQAAVTDASSCAKYRIKKLLRRLAQL